MRKDSEYFLTSGASRHDRMPFGFIDRAGLRGTAKIISKEAKQFGNNAGQVAIKEVFEPREHAILRRELHYQSPMLNQRLIDVSSTNIDGEAGTIFHFRSFLITRPENKSRRR